MVTTTKTSAATPTLKTPSLANVPVQVPVIPMFNIGVPEKKSKTKTEYPVVPDPTGQLGLAAARVRVNKELLDACKGAYETDRDFLLQTAVPFYFESCHGRSDPPSSVVINSGEGEVRMTFPDKYKSVADPATVVAVVGPQVAADHFHQSWELKIDGNELPATPRTQELLNKVVALFTDYGAEHAISLKSGIKPKKGFAAIRHSILTVVQNLALNQVVPFIPTCNTKGRE